MSVEFKHKRKGTVEFRMNLGVMGRRVDSG
jgi:hypothetical protein